MTSSCRPQANTNEPEKSVDSIEKVSISRELGSLLEVPAIPASDIRQGEVVGLPDGRDTRCGIHPVVAGVRRVCRIHGVDRDRSHRIRIPCNHHTSASRD